jgi:lipopolysaccharide biosynthesis glycosyltransferase
VRTKIYNIAISPDKKYANQGITMLHSLIVHNPKLRFHIHILNGGITKKQRLKFILFFLKYNINYSFYKVDGDQFDQAPVSLHISKSAYFRLLLSSLIPSQIHHLLYLDCDIIIQSSIMELLEIKLHGKALAASTEIISNEHRKQLNFSDDQPYFNSGVMVLNLEYWRDNLVEKSFFSFLHSQPQKIRFWDQDILNYCFQGLWVPIHPKYNVTHFYFLPNLFSFDYFNITESTLQNIRKQPSILHFTGHKKPWIEGCDHPLREYYFKYEVYLKKLIIDLLLCRKK